jgi:serine/threonine-protein kinase
VPKGTTVEVVISAGPSARSVPILIGRTLEEARAQLEPLGFVVGTITEVFSEAGAAGEILATDPEAETRAESGTAVNLTISKGPDLVLVPDLIGKTFAEAKELLTKNGLQLGSTTGPKTGVVAGADIPAGTQVRRGTQISVIFGTA